MARIRKRGLFGVLVVVIVVVLAGGYFVRQATNRGVAQPADSTAADSLVAQSDSGETDSARKEGDDDDEKKEPDPVPVEIATASPREISSYHYTTATLEPEKKVDILAKIAGEVVALVVEEGDIVSAGAVLCRVEDDEAKIALDEARINKEKQNREFERIRSVFDEKLISDKEYTEAKYQAELALTRYDAAALRYEYTRIRAPFDGVITKRHVERGQMLSVGSQLFELADTSPLLVRMYLPESEIRDIHVGQAVSIRPDNDPDLSLTGKVIRIAPEVDDRTGTVKVTAETRGRAMPGSFARVKIVTDTRHGSLTIPRRGLVSDAGELYVYVAAGDTVRRTPIRIGYQDEDFAEVMGGVELGDSVVVVGMGGLRTGTKIQVLEATLQDELSRQDDTDTIPASN